MFKIEEEERKLEAAIEETEKQKAEVNAELKELELKSSRFKELEERYLFSSYCLVKSFFFLFIFLDKIKMYIIFLSLSHCFCLL